MKVLSRVVPSLGVLVGRGKCTDFHSLDQAVLHCEAMNDVLINEYGSSQIAHDLMHLDQDACSIFQVESNWLNMRVDFTPLLCPISANGLLALDKAALEPLGQTTSEAMKARAAAASRALNAAYAARSSSISGAALFVILFGTVATRNFQQCILRAPRLSHSRKIAL